MRVWSALVSALVLAAVCVRAADVVHRRDGSAPYDEALAKQAAEYSNAAYYDGNPAEALNYGSQSQNFELGTKVSKPYFGSHVSAFTGIDKVKKLIVVAYEGTSEGPKQLVAEAILSWGINVRDCLGCKTTKYFGEAQDKLYPELQKSVKELQAKCPDCKVLFTGHSLGGAMAQIGAYKMLKDGTLKEPPKYYTFGQPKAGNPAFNEAFNKAITNAYRVTHDKDLVPSVGARAEGTNVGKEISYDNGMKSYTECAGAGCGSKLKTELVQDLKENARDTLGKPRPKWKDVSQKPIKSTKDLASRPVDFVKKQVASGKEDLVQSVDQHMKYFDKPFGYYNDKKEDIAKFAAEQKTGEQKTGDSKADAPRKHPPPMPLMANSSKKKRVAPLRRAIGSR